MSANNMHQEETATLSGKVLISGTGFIVGAGMWAILAFFRYKGGDTGVGTLNMALVVLHIALGLLIFRRVRGCWYVGLALAGIAVAASLPNHYYYLPIPVDGVTGLLLYFSRLDFPDMQLARDRGAGA